MKTMRIAIVISSLSLLLLVVATVSVGASRYLSGEPHGRAPIVADSVAEDEPSDEMTVQSVPASASVIAGEAGATTGQGNPAAVAVMLSFLAMIGWLLVRWSGDASCM